MKGITPERWSEIEKLSSQDPELLFDVILTLRQNLPLEVLNSSGLVIENLLQTAMIVTGKATYRSLRILVELPEVELIAEEETVQMIRP